MENAFSRHSGVYRSDKFANNLISHHHFGVRFIETFSLSNWHRQNWGRKLAREKLLGNQIILFTEKGFY